MSIVCVAVTCIAIVGAQALAMVCLGLRLIQRGEELAAVKGQLASSKRKNDQLQAYYNTVEGAMS